MFKLGKIVATQDDFQKLMNDNTTYEFEVYEQISLNLKIKIKDRNPPC